MANIKSNKEFSNYRRRDDLGVAYRENVSVPKGSGGAGSVLSCKDFVDIVFSHVHPLHQCLLCHFVAFKIEKTNSTS